MTQEQIKEEIAAIMDDMRTAHDWRREYLIGELKALLWVQGGGEVSRPVAFQQAVAAWDAMRKQVTP